MSISLGILSALSFNNKKGYFFAYDRKTGIVRLHGIKKIIGKNTKKMTTNSGIHPYDRNEKILNNSKQEGYFTVVFQKPNIPNKKFEKIDFIKYIKALDLVIGTGEYTGDVLKNVKANMLQRIALKRYDKDKYFAIIDTKGVLLSHPYLKKYIGKNISQLKDKNGKPFVKEILKLVKKNGKGYVKYYWFNPKSKKIEQKLSYVYLIKKLNWIILTGLYIPDIEKHVNIAKEKMKQEYYQIYYTAFFIVVAYIVIIFLILAKFSRRLQTIFNEYDLLAEEKRKKAEYNATHDTLTKANNRASFDKKLQEEYKRALRYNRALSIAMLDIDHFKNINDTLGHQVGDIILKNLSAFCQAHIRNSDFFARWGGEEFMFIFSETDLKTSIKVCDKLREDISNNKELQQVVKYTVSIGVTQLKPNDSIDSLLKRVDSALYNAKNNGRNRVESL